jgi:hypothetical protein
MTSVRQALIISINNGAFLIGRCFVTAAFFVHTSPCKSCCFNSLSLGQSVIVKGITTNASAIYSNEAQMPLHLYVNNAGNDLGVADVL